MAFNRAKLHCLMANGTYMGLVSFAPGFINFLLISKGIGAKQGPVPPIL